MSSNIKALNTLKEIRASGLEKEYVNTLINKLEFERMSSMDHNTIEVQVDSSTRKDVNEAYVSCVIQTEHGELRESKVIAKECEHVSDLESILFAFEKLQHIGIKDKHVVVYADNLPLVNQLNGLFRIRKGYIKKYIDNYKTVIEKQNIVVKYMYRPREYNRLADRVAKNAEKRDKTVKLVAKLLF